MADSTAVDSPFKFLDPYDIGDRATFFGRDRETRVLLADVISRRLVLLFAKSGTGKTSLINAGVRPELEDRDYATFYVRVLEDPTISLRNALESDPRKAPPADGSVGEQLAAVVEELDKPVAVFFDQFEEFFVYLHKDDPARADAFIEDVAAAYRNRESGVHIVFSMREEFFVEMDAFHSEIPTVFEKDSHLRLRWFNAGQAREAIAGPSAVAGVEADPELVERLVADLSLDGAIEPAQLQIVCHTLWGADGLGTLADYDRRAAGAVAKNPARRILDERLGAAFATLKSSTHLSALQQLLPALRTPRGTKYVRDLDGLVSELALPADVLRTVMQLLDDAGLVTRWQRGDLEYVELRHDYLVERLDDLAAYAGTIWPRRVLERERAAYERDGAAWEPGPGMDEVAERVRTEAERARRSGHPATGDVTLEHEDAELLFLYALQRRLSDIELLELALAHGVSVWDIVAERIAGADPTEASAALDALGGVERPEALTLLQRALGQTRLAPRALDALAALAGSTRRPDVAEHAAEALVKHLGPNLDDPERAGWAISILGRAHHVRVVEVLEPLLTAPEHAGDAEDALLGLVDSPVESVREAARAGLLKHWTGAFHAGEAQPALLHRIARVGAVESVQLLVQAGARPELAAAARKALVRLESDPSETVARGAREARRSLTAAAPPPPRRTVSAHAAPTSAAESTELEVRYGSVAKRLVAGRVVPFIGAGAVLADRPPDASWEPGSYLPSGRELAQFLAQSYAYPEDEPLDLPRIAQYVSMTVGLGPLYRDLRAIFDEDYPPSPTHRFLAGLPAALRARGRPAGLLIMTTNYDDGLERAFADRGEPVDVITYVAVGKHATQFAHRRPDGSVTVIDVPRAYSDVDPETRPAIVKLNGGIDRSDPDADSFVITEDDHINYIVHQREGLPVPIVARLRRAHFLFLGHSLRDWSLRVVLQSIWNEQTVGSISWAIQRGASDVDRVLWRRRDVEVLDIALEEYIAGLQAHLDDLN